MIWLLLACTKQEINIFVSEDKQGIISDFVDKIGDSRIQVHSSINLEKDAKKAKGWGVALKETDENLESYLIEGKKKVWTISGDHLGVQYGLADFLEGMDYRFYHPYKSYIPEELDAPEFDIAGEWQSPQMSRRGLHLHTIHPIEGYYDFWEPSEQNLERAKMVVDWTIKNRGNYIEWVGLDNITDDEAEMIAWRAHNKQIVDYIHERGMRAGIGVQLFGSGNLQNGYDLIDSMSADHTEQITERIGDLMSDADFDTLEVSFGEFFDEEPDVFIDEINQTYDAVQSIVPGIEMTSRIHVGDDLQVEYQGEEMIYYFLAAYANPDITPWVHTVMYYNLFESANGAYHHEDFTEHREFLLERLRNELPVNYFPESAYWVAFDNSVPMYLPLYIRSRWLDMVEIKKWAAEEEVPSLDDHVLFSSGWEWGYWQNDVATLRMNWKVPDSYLTVLKDIFGNYENGDQIAQTIYDTAELQKKWLIENNLDAYTCGVDNIMVLGYTQDIVSQPKRLSFEQMMEVDNSELDAIRSKLDAYSGQLLDITENFGEQTDPWLQEIEHGLWIDFHRANYMSQLIYAILEAKSGGSPNSKISEAEEILLEAQKIVDIQHSQAWDPDIKRLTGTNSNATLYQFGYLHRADELCYWNRELIQVKNLLQDSSEYPPGCGL